MEKVISYCCDCFKLNQSDQDPIDRPARLVQLGPAPTGEEDFSNQLQQQQPQHAPPALSPLDTSQPHPRVWQDMPDPDPGTPPTPTGSVMQRYRDPGNLPGPDETGIQKGGYSWVRHGRVLTHDEYLTENQQFRAHMTASPEGQKYLAHREQGAGPDVYSTPYAHYSDRPRVTSLYGKDLNKKTPETQLHIPRNGIPFVTERAPVDQATVSMRGGPFSAATMWTHEAGHTARITDMRNEQEGLSKIEAGLWTNREEQPVILKVEGPTARAHGEMQRDSHSSAGKYRTSGLASTEAVYPEAKRILEAPNNLDVLAHLSRQLDTENFDPAEGFIRPSQVDLKRLDLACDLTDDLNAAHASTQHSQPAQRNLQAQEQNVGLHSAGTMEHESVAGVPNEGSDHSSVKNVSHLPR